MTKWETAPLSKVLRHRKEYITIDDLTNYKLCRVQLHRRGVVLRRHQSGAEIRTKKQQVCRSGDFIVAEMDAKVGGYGFVPSELEGAIVSGHYYLFEVDKRKLYSPYLEVVSQTEILQKQIFAKGSTNYSSIRPNNVLAWHIPLPDMETQKRVAHNFQAIQKKLVEIRREITQQETLLEKLKLAILQDAIQGKLTTAWRKENPEVEPASQLLEHIRKEKQRLIAEKKLRKEKLLSPISLTEVPFKIPKGWEWCRLDDILNVRAGIAKGGKRYTGSIKPTPYLRVANVQRGYLELDQVKLLDLPVQEAEKYALQNYDLLVTEGGDPDKVGRCAVWHNEIEGCIHQNHIFCMRPYLRSSVETDFVPLILNSPFCQDYFLGSYKQTTNLASINKTVLRSAPIALPSLVEQAFIIKRVKMLMTTCQMLETEIEKSRSHAVHLLQTILKESFN